MKTDREGLAPFSRKQMQALTWWCKSSRYEGMDAIICDGAVRSGKTLCMSLSFIAWAFYAFEDTAFAICGRTIQSLRRNVAAPLLPLLERLGFTCRQKLAQNLIEVTRKKKGNRFYLFGGKDESSAALIQGMTLGGVLFDEVALMPRSFVEQALARCSLPRSRFWFNCNPEHPQHWFRQEWILKAAQKNALYLHFTMEDNPSLEEDIRRRYRSLYSGTFYQRFILGEWVAAEGLVYPMFQETKHIVPAPPEPAELYYISCDYGTVNPASFGLWGLRQGIWYRLQEYYHDSRKTGVQHTDEEYYAALCILAGGRPVEAVIVDPSAASFLECIRRHGEYRVLPAKNDVLAGIRRVSDILREGRLRVCEGCADSIREFGQYRWDPAAGKDCPRKENDHAMDDIRYFVSTIMNDGRDGFFAMAAPR